ncbi:MAG TPA: nucleotidyltransferase domain-containing protein [Candidatus Nanoarchaeia archaeon]|nr:nucleotidyltransferase domain-containing protein [Candidatus Nanoarchaeia archaeon]
MLHKNNYLELIELLRKEPQHIRKIANTLNLIPSTVMRALKELQKKGIVNYNKEGKNNKYFLKETPEAQIYIYITEYYKLLKILQNTLLRGIIKELIDSTNGELIILYGSYAKGTATARSDIDIYVETKDQKLKQKLQKISEKISIDIGEIDSKSMLGKEIIKNHIIIQNPERFYGIIK